MKSLYAVAAFAVSFAPAYAQEGQPEASAIGQPVALAPASEPSVRMLPASTQVSISCDNEISSKKIEVGDKFQFTVVNDVVEGGTVAIPRGSKVQATVTFKTGKAVGGKSGKFELSFDTINVRGADYKVRGTHRQEGKGNTVAAVFATWIISGRSAVMLPGQTVTIYTDQQLPY